LTSSTSHAIPAAIVVRVKADDIAKLTLELSAERSRESLLARLGEVSSLAPDDLVAIIVEVLLLVGQDADRLKLRVAELLAARFARSSDKASLAQLALFAKALQSAVGPSGDAPGSIPEVPAKPTVPELVQRTDGEIDALLAGKRKAREEERERRRAAAKIANSGAPGCWPTHLPIEERTVDLPEGQIACPDTECGAVRGIIGRRTTWRIEFETTSKVVLTHMVVRACQKHHGGPVAPPTEPSPVDGGHVGFGIAARALWLRFAHNLPIRRIAEMFSADGLPISGDMLHTLFETTVRRAGPVITALIAQVRAAGVVNLDDTPVLIVDSAGPNRRQRRQGRIWLALGDGKFAWFFATKTWKAVEAEARLGKITGVLQGDGYGGFPKLTRELGIRLAGCMAHLRRKLLRAFKANDPRAAEPMGLIEALYRIEKLAKLQELDVAGLEALRQERSVPIMDALEAWAVKVAPGIEPGSPLGKAWTYFDNQRGPLRVFLTDGRVSIDNNAAERGLRRITIGRKLWLFFRSDGSAERAARLGSLFLTARLHGADELAYMRWLLSELARREWSDEAARALLPDVWLAEHQAQERGGVEA
jgi:transposase